MAEGKGSEERTLNLGYHVPKDEIERVEAVFMKHAKWMEDHYIMDDGLKACYFSKSPLFNDPTNPADGATEDMLFSINEEFNSAEAVGNHIANAKKNDYFPEFGKIMGDYAKHAQPLGEKFFELETSRAGEGCKPITGATLNIGYTVPGDKADEVQALFMKHANWMKEFYAGSTEFLICCYFSRSPCFKVAADPSQGDTGEVCFSINEQFASKEAVGRHMDTAKKNDYFADFGKVLHDYGKHVQPLGEIFFKIR